MGLFGNRTISTGKSFTSVIKNEAPENALLWKHDTEDFNTGSVLVVEQSEQALFIRDGVIQQVFDKAGRYTLTTDNYPFITALRNMFTGGVSSFHCEVYFIRNAHSREIEWGMSIQMRDPKYEIMARVMAQGAYKIQIENGTLLLTKMVGNGQRVFNESDMVKYFRSEFSQIIKSVLQKQIELMGHELLGLSAYLPDYAQAIQPGIADALKNYGVRLVNITVGGLEVPQDDPFRIRIESVIAERAARAVDGITWGQQQAASILNEVARNPGAGGVASAGAGLGMGVMAGNAIGQMAQQLFSEGVPGVQQTGETPTSRRSGRFGKSSGGGCTCAKCGAELAAGAKFCSSCGEKVENASAFCPYCGAEVAPGARFCSSCGKSLQ